MSDQSTRARDDSVTTLTDRVVIAQQALQEANARRKVAVDAVVEFALRAVIDGEDVEAIMDACGFKEPDSELESSSGLFGFFGVTRGTRRQRFAQWMGQALANRIADEEAGS